MLIGNGGGIGGSGGGLLDWDVAEMLEMNGWLALRGSDAQGGNGGGGSGGGVFIKTTNMTGHGTISVNGGNGRGLGSGGAGGRVGIHCRWRFQFGGVFQNYGGDGGSSHVRSHAGAAGTTYKEENFRELEYRHKKYDSVHNTTFMAVDHAYLHSDNIGKQSPAAAVIMEGHRDYFEFDEMELTGMGRLLIYHPSNVTHVELIVHRFIGDRSGQLHLRSNQTVYVEVVESVSNVTEAPCSYIIDADSEIVLPTEFHIHGTRSTIGGLVTGVHHIYIENEADMEFSSSGHTAQIANGSKSHITPQGHFAFDTITVKQGGVVGFRKITDWLFFESSEFRVKYQGTLYMNKATIHSSYVWIESEGIFHLDGKGDKAETGEGAGFTENGIGYGASHGGYGGSVIIDHATHPYNSIYYPVIPGSGGGNGGGMGGAGGGVLDWVIGQYIELNGLLSLHGDHGDNGNAGGGSGGSLIIRSLNMTGHGEISVRGGDGVGLGCGGSGGRVAIHNQWRYSYGGKFTDRGGAGGNNYKLDRGAAAGTIFLENNLRTLEYRILKYAPETNDTYFQVDHRYIHVDNEQLLVPVATMIMENNTFYYEFDEMELTGDSRLVFYHPPLSFNVTVVTHIFIGDKTGRIHIRLHQYLWSEFIESETNITEAPCSYIIDEGAELFVPTEVRLHGTKTVLDGLVTGVHHLYVEDGADVIVSSTAQTALMENRAYVHITEPGNFSLPTINVKTNGLLTFSKIQTDMTITASFLEVKHKGIILMNHGFIDAGDVDVESEGQINLEGTGYGEGHGPGAGTLNSGGSYGGIGGGSYPGKAYGSLFTPWQLGSGGGGTSAGSGGGYVSIKVGRTIHINGRITVKGGSSSGNAGGGSGGSLLVDAFKMTGHGVLNAAGGDGSGTGAAGSGGRIAAHITFSNTYGGHYICVGGIGGISSNHHLSDGGPGTVYKYESNRGPQYRELKYNPRLNHSSIEPEHSKLTVDNLMLQTDNPAIVMEENSLYYEFDEVQVEGHSYVHFYHPVDNVTVNVVIHELTGNKKGLVRIQSHQRLIVHFVESTHTWLDAPCGLHVDRGGEAVLPTKLTILTERFILEGRLTGVEELTIERDGQMIISSDAHTHAIPLHTQWYTDDPEHSFTPGLITLQQIQISNAGDLLIQMNPTKPTIYAAVIRVKSGGYIGCQSFKVEFTSSIMDIEFTGIIDGSGFGYPREFGPGRGYSDSYVASGGSYASLGKNIFILLSISD